MRDQMTELGLNLLPTLIVIKQWRDKWLAKSDHGYVKFVISRDKLSLAELNIHTADERALQHSKLLSRLISDAAPAYGYQQMLAVK